MPPAPPTLDEALEFVREDECVEVTPGFIRLRKVELDPTRAREGVAGKVSRSARRRAGRVGCRTRGAGAALTRADRAARVAGNLRPRCRRSPSAAACWPRCHPRCAARR